MTAISDFTVPDGGVRKPEMLIVFVPLVPWMTRPSYTEMLRIDSEGDE